MTAPIPPSNHILVINDLALSYVDYGSPREGAPDLLFLHGLTSAWGAWRRIAEHFARDYRVLALDQRGHGESEWAPADRYRTEDYLSDLEQFVDEAGLRRFILAGQSMGGHHTIAYTARHPERVICALANDIPPAIKRGNVDYAAQYPGGRHRPVASVQEWIEARRPAAEFTPQWAHEQLARETLRPAEGGFVPKHDPHAPMHWAPADLWDEARTITRPMLFIRGGHSAVLSAQMLREMESAIPTARSVTLEQAGHQTYLDMEPEWIATAAAFFAAHAAPA